MIVICSMCGNETDGDTIEAYRDKLSSIEESMFDDSGMCPECFESVK